MSEPGLDEVLDALPQLGRGELLAISAAYREGADGARDAARARARSLAERLRRTADLDRLHGSIAQWASSDVARSSAMTLGGFSDPILVDLRMQAVPALLDVATALLLGRALDDASRTILLEPWQALAPDD